MKMNGRGMETGLIPIAEAETNTMAFCSAFEMTVLRILVVVNRLSRSLALKSSLNLQTQVSKLNVLFFTASVKVTFYRVQKFMTFSPARFTTAPVFTGSPCDVRFSYE